MASPKKVLGEFKESKEREEKVSPVSAMPLVLLGSPRRLGSAFSNLAASPSAIPRQPRDEAVRERGEEKKEVEEKEDIQVPTVLTSNDLLDVAEDLLLSPLAPKLVIELRGEDLDAKFFLLPRTVDRPDTDTYSYEFFRPGLPDDFEEGEISSPAEYFNPWRGSLNNPVEFTALEINYRFPKEARPFRIMTLYVGYVGEETSFVGDTSYEFFRNYTEEKSPDTTYASPEYVYQVFQYTPLLAQLIPLLQYFETWFDKHFQLEVLDLPVGSEEAEYYAKHCSHGLIVEPKLGPTRAELEEEKQASLLSRRATIAAQGKEAIGMRNRLRAEQVEEKIQGIIESQNTRRRNTGAGPLSRSDVEMIRHTFTLPPLTAADEQVLLEERKLVPMTSAQEAAYLASFGEEELAEEYTEKDFPLYTNLSTGECWSVKALLELWSNAFDRWPIQRPRWPTGERKEFSFIEASAVLLLAISTGLALPRILAYLLYTLPDGWRNWYNGTDDERVQTVLNMGFRFLYTKPATAEAVGVWAKVNDLEIEELLHVHMVPDVDFITWEPRGLPVELTRVQERQLNEEQKQARAEQEEKAYETFQAAEWWKELVVPISLRDVIAENTLTLEEQNETLQRRRTSFIQEINVWMNAKVYTYLFENVPQLPGREEGEIPGITALETTDPGYPLLREIWTEFPQLLNYVTDPQIQAYVKEQQ